MKGLFKVNGDENVAAIDVRDNAVVVFPNVHGLANRDQPSFGTL